MLAGNGTFQSGAQEEPQLSSTRPHPHYDHPFSGAFFCSYLRQRVLMSFAFGLWAYSVLAAAEAWVSARALAILEQLAPTVALPSAPAGANSTLR